MKIVLADKEKFAKGLIMNGYSMRSFGEKAGISVSSISMIINGKRHPSAKVAKRIVDTLGFTFDDIFFIECVSNSEQKEGLHHGL